MSLTESVCESLDLRSARNTLFEVLFTLRPIDVIVHRHEDDSILNFFKFDSVLCHLFFESRGADPVLRVLGKKTTRTRLALRQLSPFNS